MAYLPHTEADVAAMLTAAGAGSLDDLFAQVPASLRLTGELNLPRGLSEAGVEREVAEALALNRIPRLSFAGAGAYEHYIPAAVKAIVSRGEYLTAYTPYQPEASQGSLQTIFEFQTIVCELTGLDVANASLYEAGSALAEAVVMAVRTTGRTRVLLAAGVHPWHRRVLETYTRYLGVELAELPDRGGATDAGAVAVGTDVAAVVVQHPNVFGCLEPVDRIAAAAKGAGALTIASCNPVSLGLLKPPGTWGADIAVGDVQPIGVPVAFGGPYAGYLACRRDLVRKMPGRLVGATVDAKGRRGFVLTLQAREQHIRREKATSNICTNQALVALMFTVAASLIGGKGLRRMAEACAAGARSAARRLGTVPGVVRLHSAPFFHEFTVRLPRSAAEVSREMAERFRIVPGVPLSRLRPGTVGNDGERDLIVCVTETKRESDVEDLARSLETVLAGAPAGGRQR